MIRFKLAFRLAVGIGVPLVVATAVAQNPIIRDQFTADPTARVFEGRVYVYPSHDIPTPPGKGRPNWFCMEDYHVFSSENLIDWKDHGVIVSQTNVEWADPNGYAMWAPDCVFKNGKYYFYFPATAKEKGFRIGVAVGDKPYGPFKPEAKAIEGVRGIDPSVLVDKDGTSYIYYSLNKIFVARLKPNMVELDSEPQVIDNLPTKGLLEGPFVFERNGIYYLTYPHVENKTERLEYTTSSSPLGPFRPMGVIMDESASGCWTNHQSIVEYQGQWYLFYHDKDLSPDFDKNRSIRADRLFFNADGTIQKVVPTLRGVGIADARTKLQIDRYSATSKEGVAVSFLNDADKREGWKVALDGQDAWVRFDDVNFGTKRVSALTARALSATGGQLEIHLDTIDGPVVARVDVGKDSSWKVTTSKVTKAPSGVHKLVVALRGGGHVELDWIKLRMNRLRALMNFSHFIPTRILFGKGQLANLHKQALPGTRALIVLSAGPSMRKHGYLARLEEQLDLAKVTHVVFDKILPNPIKAHVVEGAAYAREHGCDFVVGLGGGSPIDAAKSIAMMATNPGDYWDYIWGGSGKGLPVPNAPLPIVAITTTAGTGTEADPWTVITKEDTHEKIGYGYDKTFPVLSIVDPDLMSTVPPHLTAYQGFDALFHSTEGYISTAANPISDLYALKAIELVGTSLAAAVADGADEGARANVALANTLAGMVESTSTCTSEHSLEHALSGFHPDLAHGAGLIILSVAYYTHFAARHACDDRMIAMAKALGKGDAATAMDFVEALRELQRACGVADLKMSDYGIQKDDMARYAATARTTMGGLFKFDPAPLTDADSEAILTASWR